MSINIQEYQAKTILRDYGIDVPTGHVITSSHWKKTPLTSEQISDLNKNNGVDPDDYVAKVQILAGGRGKAGGVKLFGKNKPGIVDFINKLMDKPLVTHQTGPEGQVVKAIYIESASKIDKEYYLSLIVDRETDQLVFIGSSEGGMDIEQVAEETPEKIFKCSFDLSSGYSPYMARKMGFAMGLDKSQVSMLNKIMESMFTMLVSENSIQIEINPLATVEGRLVALDAKLGFDGNAISLGMNERVESMKDPSEEDPGEIEASKYDLNYIKMDGEIGCMVNGAGLAMATMDIIQYNDSSPANFLDIGGGATEERVQKAFEIICSDQNVKAILVNIFGGIVKCDMVAEGIIGAVKKIGLTIPLVVRLSGTNCELGKNILENSDLKITAANDLAEAAKKVVSIVKGGK